jgi:hypothetical protein
MARMTKAEELALLESDIGHLQEQCERHACEFSDTSGCESLQVTPMRVELYRLEKIWLALVE